MKLGYHVGNFCVVAVCAALNTSGSLAAEMKVFTCSGELWNIEADSKGTSWVEVGHGVHQCSIRSAVSENAKKVLSVCNFRSACSIKVAINAQRLQKSAADGECDDVCIFEGDNILSVTKGKLR